MSKIHIDNISKTTVHVGVSKIFTLETFKKMMCHSVGQTQIGRTSKFAMKEQKYLDDGEQFYR